MLSRSRRREQNDRGHRRGREGTKWGRNESGDRKARRMSYTIHTYKPCETFRMHIRLPRWPTVDFRPGRELTFALPLCANSHKDSLSLPLLSFSSRFLLFHPASPSRSISSCVFFLPDATLSLSLTDVYDNVSGNMLKFRVKFSKYAYLLYRDINLYDFALSPHMKLVTRKK